VPTKYKRQTARKLSLTLANENHNEEIVMATLEGLEQQKAALEKQINKATKNQKQEDLRLVKQLRK
jgi:translation elongation factor EF-G